MATLKEDRTIGELFSQLAGDTSTLISQEVRLAKLELGQKAAQVGKRVGLAAVGGGLAFAGLLAVVAAAILFLGNYMPYWVASLVVGIAVMAIGYVLSRQQISALKD